MSYDTFMKLFREQPGIKEYGIDERIVENELATLIPAESYLGTTYDFEKKKMYFYSTPDHNTKSVLFTISLRGWDEKEMEKDRLKLFWRTQLPLRWMRWELDLIENPDQESRERLENCREEELIRIKNELWPTTEMIKEERDFLEENCPYRFGDLFAAMRLEIERPGNGLKYGYALRQFEIDEEINKDVRFGFGELQVCTGVFSVEIYLNHDYKLEGRTGKNYKRQEHRRILRLYYDALRPAPPKQHLTDIAMLLDELCEVIKRAHQTLEEWKKL